MKNLLFFSLVLFSFFSCQVDPFNPTNTNTTSAPPPTPNACANADGALWAVQSITSQQSLPNVPAVDITIGLGVGVFTSNGLTSASPSRVNVGTVTANNNTDLDYEGETYISKPGTNDPQGINWSSGVTWKITGDNGYTAFTHTPSNRFPTVSAITSNATVTKSAGYTLSCNTITGADSVLFLVGDVAKTLGPTATSHTFSASDLSSLANGTNIAQIVPYTFSSKDFGGKTICFGKEAVRQLVVEIQ